MMLRGWLWKSVGYLMMAVGSIAIGLSAANDLGYYETLVDTKQADDLFLFGLFILNICWLWEKLDDR